MCFFLYRTAFREADALGNQVIVIWSQAAANERKQWKIPQQNLCQFSAKFFQNDSKHDHAACYSLFVCLFVCVCACLFSEKKSSSVFGAWNFVSCYVVPEVCVRYSFLPCVSQ